MNNFAKKTFDLEQTRIELTSKPWLVACLCAEWCETCQTYRQAFHELSTLHTDKCFTWIDIEDQSELVEKIDIENFPTILIQFNDKILFLGTVLPEIQQIHRMLQSLENSLDSNNEPLPLLSKEQLPTEYWSLRQQLLQ